MPENACRINRSELTTTNPFKKERILMAKHKVVMKLPPREIKRADVSFKVKRNGKLLGTLEISNGSIVWYPSGTTYGSKMSWAKFDKMMDENASRVELR